MRNLAKFELGVAAGAALVLFSTVSAMAVEVEAKIYSYSSHENYCPVGLQPITISGVICCGVPNQRQTYQQVMKHPVPRVHHRQVDYSARAECRERDKGCL